MDEAYHLGIFSGLESITVTSAEDKRISDVPTVSWCSKYWDDDDELRLINA